jgi:glutathione peroxidase-family protein
MNKKLKFKTLELLNFEGPVLIAHKAKSIYVITDQWKEIVNVLIQYEMEGFLNGEFPIVDSSGKAWVYTNESSNAKRSIDEVTNFIKIG